MTFLGFILAMLLVVWIMLPLLRKDTPWVSLADDFADLEDEKQRVYGNIADLEFDYAMGRLSDKDFTTIRQSFLVEAGAVIKKLDQAQTSDIMKQIEEDLKHLPKKKASSKKKAKVCGACGTENLKNANFCMSCGEGLS